MSHKSVPEECPTRVSHKSAPRGVLQECRVRVSHKSVSQECRTRVSHKRVSHRSDRQECPTRVFHKSVLQECHLDICSFLNVFAFGFVGSIFSAHFHPCWRNYTYVCVSRPADYYQDGLYGSSGPKGSARCSGRATAVRPLMTVPVNPCDALMFWLKNPKLNPGFTKGIAGRGKLAPNCAQCNFDDLMIDDLM